MGIMQYFMDAYWRSYNAAKERTEIPQQIVYRSEKGAPLTFAEVDAQTKYFVTKLDIIEKKLDKLLAQQEKK